MTRTIETDTRSAAEERGREDDPPRGGTLRSASEGAIRSFQRADRMAVTDEWTAKEEAAHAGVDTSQDLPAGDSDA